MARWLVFLVGIATIAACHPLDRRAPFGQPAYARQHAAVSTAADAAPLARDQLRAGWARVEIEPPSGAPLAGYGDRDGAPAEGVLDPTCVRAFVLAAGDFTAVVFTADLLLVGRDVADAVREGLAGEIEADHVFFTASHTHSGPGGSISGLVWEAAMGPYDEAAEAAVVDAHVKAARAALADVGPARIGHASVRVPGLIANRVEKGGTVDDELLAVVLERTDTQRRAAWWVYGAHAVTLPAQNLRLSADYPGKVGAAFEGDTYDVVGFAAGGVGSANPKHERPHDNAWIVEPLQGALRVALGAARGRSRTKVSLAAARARLPRPDLHYRVSTDVAVWSAPIAAVIDMPEVDYGALVVNDLVMSFLPAEISGSLTRATRARAKKSGVTLAILPFNGTYLGYVVPRRVYDLPEDKGEEMLHYETHVVSFLGPWGADYIMNLGIRLAGGLYRRFHPTRDDRFDWMASSAVVNAGTLDRPGETETSYEKAESSN